METTVLDKLKKLLKQVQANKPWFFVFVPALTFKDARLKAEPFLLVDRARPVHAANFAKLCSTAFGLQLKGTGFTGALLAGTVVKGRAGLEFTVNKKLSKGVAAMLRTAEKQVKLFGLKSRIDMLSRPVVSFEEGQDLEELEESPEQETPEFETEEPTLSQEARSTEPELSPEQRYQELVKELQGLLSETESLAPERRKELATQVGQARDLAKNKDHAAACERLEQVIALLSEAESESASQAEPDPFERYHELAAQVRESLSGLTMADPEQKKAFARLIVNAKAAAGDKDWPKAISLLEEALALMSSARTALDGRSERQREGFSLVKLQKSRLAWEAAVKSAHVEIQKLVKAVLADPELQQDVDFESIKARIVTIDTLLEPFENSLFEALDVALVTEEPDARDLAVRQCLDIIKDYRGILASDPVLLDLDDNPVQPVKAMGSLSKTLDSLAKVLAGV